jgi:hypothetical protein
MARNSKGIVNAQKLLLIRNSGYWTLNLDCWNYCLGLHWFSPNSYVGAHPNAAVKAWQARLQKSSYERPLKPRALSLREHETRKEVTRSHGLTV